MSKAIRKVQALELAKYLVKLNSKNEDYGEVLTNLKIQKLLYYIQGFHLAFFDEPIFDDKITAWKYGPVIIPLYEKLKKFGNGPVYFDNFNKINLSKDQKELIEAVFNQIGQYSAWKLVELTHSEDPWKNVNIHSEITQESLQEFFKKKIIA